MSGCKGESVLVRITACAALLAAGGAFAEGVQPVAGAIGETKFIADVRLRYEFVDQEPFRKDANAVTARARLGFETGKAWNTSLLVEGDAVWPLQTHYNSTINGNVTYPVVADPEAYELNRLQLTNTSIIDTRSRSAGSARSSTTTVSWAT